MCNTPTLHIKNKDFRRSDICTDVCKTMLIAALEFLMWLYTASRLRSCLLYSLGSPLLLFLTNPPCYCSSLTSHPRKIIPHPYFSFHDIVSVDCPGCSSGLLFRGISLCVVSFFHSCCFPFLRYTNTCIVSAVLPQFSLLLYAILSLPTIATPSLLPSITFHFLLAVYSSDRPLPPSLSPILPPFSFLLLHLLLPFDLSCPPLT